MATIYVDKQPYNVKDGQNLLSACLSVGLNVPYFCWHPAMHSVGACRQCAVKAFKDEHDTAGRIVMACMTPALDGARISIDDPEARQFRATVIELLMVNHPHDCPVCDEGGECHLQDMTVMTGHIYREFRFKKRTHRNQDLGPFINHEMNRCIACYRCLRFYCDYAGGRDFDVMSWHNYVYFGRFKDGPLENEFGGNLVEICPTGVFTAKPFKNKFTRKWDLQTAPSVCVHCGLGCNIIPGERYGLLRRIQTRYNGEVNGYFLCDRGRFGYEFVNSDRRIRSPMLRGPSGQADAVAKTAALQSIAGILRESRGTIGIGSPRASLEANYALRELVGPEHFHLGMSESEHQLVSTAVDLLRDGPARCPSLNDVASADAVFVLGEDVTNSAPMLALNLRQSIFKKPIRKLQKFRIHEWEAHSVREALQKERGPLFTATAAATRLDEVSTKTFRGAPDDLARLGFAVAHELDGAAPQVNDLPQAVRELAHLIAAALLEAEHPLVLSGTGCGSEAVMRAAANVARALCARGRPAKLCLTVAECNSMGLALMGGKGLAGAFDEVRSGRADTLVVLENDLYLRAQSALIDELLSKSKHVIVIDHLTNATVIKAQAVLPASTFAEATGTLVNNEARAQRFFSVFAPPGDIQESWRWLRDVGAALGRADMAWRTFDQISAAMAAELPVFSAVPGIAPPASFRASGQKIPRQSHRASGRTAMVVDGRLTEGPPPEDEDSALAFSMEGYKGEPPSALMARFWSPGWNSIQAINKFQIEIGGPLHGGDPGKRLIEPPAAGKVTYFDQVPAAFGTRNGEWLIVGLHHIFGSEELSLLSPGIAQMAPQPYLALSPADAERLQVRPGDRVALDLGVPVDHLPVKVLAGLPQGVAGFPLGLPGMRGLTLPAWGKVRREKEQAGGEGTK